MEEELGDGEQPLEDLGVEVEERLDLEWPVFESNKPSSNYGTQ